MTNVMRDKLLALRTEALKATEDGADAAGVVELDQTRVGRLSRMDAMQAQEMARAANERRQQHLLDIDRALSRIDAGDYGYCAQCGEDIDPRRLDFDPTAEHCIHCAAARESR